MKPFFKFLPLVVLLVTVFFSGCRQDEFYLQNEPALSVSFNDTIVGMGFTTVAIDVESTRRWNILTTSDDDGWYAITPTSLSGEYDGRIMVTMMANEWGPRTLTLNVVTAGGLLEEITIFQEGLDAEVLLFETFGPGGDGNTPLAGYIGFSREGAGAENVMFAGNGVDIRTSSASPSAMFSGAANVMFAAAGNANLYINNIELLGSRQIQISFATNQTNDVLSLYLAFDGSSDWQRLNFTKETTTWGRVNLRAVLPSAINPSTMNLRFTAGPTQFGTRLDDVRVVGIFEVPRPRLSLSQTTFNNVNEGGASLSVGVSTNRAWTAETDYGWLDLTSNSGDGSANLEIVVRATPLAMPRTGTITVRTADGDLSEEITIHQAGRELGAVIFTDNFGVIAADAISTVADFSGWNIRGSSANSIWYSADNTMTLVRGNEVSTGYRGASGGANVMLGTVNGGTFIVNGIMTGNNRSFQLSFGTNETQDVISVYFAVNDELTWTAIPFGKTTNTWGLVETVFGLADAVNSLRLKFVSQQTPFGARIDDIELRGSDELIPLLAISSEALAFPRLGGTQSLYVTSNGSWTITQTSGTTDWLFLSTTTGSGNATVNISLLSNSGADREASFRIESTDGAFTREFTVSQAGIQLSIAPESFAFQRLAETYTLVINSNTDWSVTRPGADTWLTLNETTGTNDGTLTISVEENLGLARQSILVFETACGFVSREFVVTQDGVQLTVTPRLVAFNRNGGSQVFLINSNASWTVTTSDPWVTINQSSGSNDALLTVNVGVNTTGGYRYATVTVRVEGLPEQSIVIEQNNIEVTTLAHWVFTSSAGGATSILDPSSGATLSSDLPVTFTGASATIWRGGWHEAVGQHWLLTIPVVSEITAGAIDLDFIAFGTSTSPRDWIVQISRDGTNWIDGDAYTLTTSGEPGNIPTEINNVSVSAELPESIAAGGRLYIRLATASTTSISGATVVVGGNSRLADVKVRTSRVR